MGERQRRKRRQQARWDYRIARHRLWTWLKEQHGYDPVFMAMWSDEQLIHVCEDVMLRTFDGEVADVYQAFLTWETQQHTTQDAWYREADTAIWEMVKNIYAA